jgi:hypothetical protein
MSDCMCLDDPPLGYVVHLLVRGSVVISSTRSLFVEGLLHPYSISTKLKLDEVRRVAWVKWTISVHGQVDSSAHHRAVKRVQ